MAYQSTLRLATQLSTVSGTKKRDVRPENIFWIMRQNNVVGALTGTEHIGNDGKSLVKSPKLIKTVKIEDYATECFSNQEIEQNFLVTTGAAATGTALTVSDANDQIYVNAWMQVAETRDVVYVSASASGTLTIARQTGAAAITAGMHLIAMGQISGESSTNPGFIIRDEDQIINYTTELHKAFRVSLRESNVKRYTGSSYENLRKRCLIEINRDMENLVIGSKSFSAITGLAASTSRGLEGWAVDGNGTSFDFGGTVEPSECRELGDVTSEWSSNRKICLTSQKVISAFMSSLDTKLRLNPSELKEKCGLPQAKNFDLGADSIEFVPCNFYQQAGKEGQGVIFDPTRIEIRYLMDLTLFECGPEDDSTQTSDLRGDWYMDHGAVVPRDGGKSMVFFEGANSVAS